VVDNPEAFVRFFRAASPYIHAHRGRTFVVVFGGEAVADPAFPAQVHDLALLASLGVRLVLVHGSRPQVDDLLRARGIAVRYHGGVRITTPEALACVKEAAGRVRVEVEALLSMGLANSPMAGARVRVQSGNFVTARPLGVRDGTDFGHTGQVRRIDGNAIARVLDQGAVALVSHVGYSPTGEVFNLTAAEVASAAAVALGADKLLCLLDPPGLADADGRPVRELDLPEAEAMLGSDQAAHHLPEATRAALAGCVTAVVGGVRRAHLLDRTVDGVLLKELFTRDGVGTLVTADRFESTRPAAIDDVGGILALIEPLEAAGVLVPRPRERLETEIGGFTVMDRDGTVIACAALHPFPEAQVAELACLAVHPDYAKHGRGDSLLSQVERQAAQQGVRRLFVLTTQTAHWFQERGFVPAQTSDLPVRRQVLVNYQRGAKVYIKDLVG
jgi:amino-acid N-acetyltransferase